MRIRDWSSDVCSSDLSWEQSVRYVKDRPGHDRRYAIDASKIKRELGWEPKHRFEEAIERTINWYRENESWWQQIKSGEYLKYSQQKRSEEGRVGKEWVRPGKSRWARDHLKKKK